MTPDSVDFSFLISNDVHCTAVSADAWKNIRSQNCQRYMPWRSACSVSAIAKNMLHHMGS